MDKVEDIVHRLIAVAVDKDTEPRIRLGALEWLDRLARLAGMYDR